MTRSMLIPVWLVSAALAGAAGCSKDVEANARKTEPTVQVEVTTATVRPMPRYLSLTGSLTAHRTSEVASDGAGKVTETLVERGSFVEQGAPLVKLDARTARLSASEARAQADASRAQRTLALSECQRAERLLAEEAITRAEYDRMRSQCDATSSSTVAAAARAALAGKAVGDAIVRAPFAGMIAERAATVGEYVRAGTPVATIVELDPLRLELTVPESDVGLIRSGQTVTFEVAAFPGRRFEGAIRYIGPAVRRASRDLVVEALVDNHDHALRPGLFALAQVEVGEEPLPTVPTAALREEGSTSRIFAIVEGRLEERVVQVGPRRGADLAILTGVRPGERIVARVTPELSDGLAVR